MRGKSGKKAAKAEKKEIAKANTRNIFLLLLVVGVVAVSGCIFGGGGSVSTGGNGISITDFSSSITEVSDCDKPARINLDIENAGGKPVDTGNVLVCLGGKNFPGKTSEQMWSVDSSTPQCQSSKKKLDAPDNIKNIPGGAASFKWTVNSPFVPFPLTRTDGFNGRVFYKYSSRTSATVFFISENELAVAKQKGQSLPSSPLIDKTSSPVDISIDVPQPVVGQSGDAFTLKVTLSNVGGGTVFDSTAISFSDSSFMPSVPEEKLNQITIKVDTSLDAGGNTESGFCNADLKNVELRKGSSVTIPCDIKINSQIRTLQSFPILLTASYGYFIDSSEIPMAVSGKKNKDPATGCNKGVSSGTAQPSVPAPPGADTAAPTITNRVPARDAINFQRDGNIVITFSEEMQDAAKDAVTLMQFSDDSVISVTKTWNAGKTELTLNPFGTDPNQRLGGNNLYTVKVTSAAKDSAGNAFAGDSWNFRAAD